jgi:CheY-like chemotaxis protein
MELHRMALILVVDDTEEVCESICASLQSRDHVVHAVHAVQDGIDALQRSLACEPYAVAIVALRLSGGCVGTDSETAGMRVVKEALQIPFLEPIVLTVPPSAVTAAEALQRGVFACVTRAESGCDEDFLKRLVAVVERALENREVMRTLDESLREVRHSFAEVADDDVKGAGFAAARLYFAFAERGHEFILRARGRLPARA